MRVMVVEDNRKTRELLSAQLRGGGHIVLGANCAASALASLEIVGCPDVAVVDIDLPGRDGLDFLEQVRRHRCPQQPGTVILSAVSPPAAERTAASVTARYLGKHPTATQLLEAIAEVHLATNAVSAAEECTPEIENCHKRER